MGRKNLDISVLWRRADGAYITSPDSRWQHPALPQLYPVTSKIIPGYKGGLGPGRSRTTEKTDH